MAESLTVDFIGIGSFRCGTSWLTHALRCHPQIGISEPKEIRYFNEKDYDRGEVVPNKNYEHPISWYENHFGHCKPQQVIGEFSPIYLYDEAALQKIKHFYPKAKLLLNLRNPIDRAYSHYWLDQGIARIETCSFEQALKKYPHYVEMGFYSRYVKKYFATFSREQILIQVFDDILSKPEETLEETLKFLGVKVSITSEMLNADKNPSSRFKKSKLATDVFLKTSRWLESMKMNSLLSTLRRNKGQKLFRTLNAKLVKLPDMDQESRQRLYKLFQGEIKELGCLINRDVSHWR